MKNWTKNFNYQSASTHYKLQEMILSQGDDSQLQPIKSIISMVETLEGMLESMPEGDEMVRQIKNSQKLMLTLMQGMQDARSIK